VIGYNEQIEKAMHTEKNPQIIHRPKSIETEGFQEDIHR
jgi:hypothetical protein